MIDLVDYKNLDFIILVSKHNILVASPEARNTDLQHWTRE